MEIVVERVERAKSGAIWLFSSKTLDAIPALLRAGHQEPGRRGGPSRFVRHARRRRPSPRLARRSARASRALLRDDPAEPRAHAPGPPRVAPAVRGVRPLRTATRCRACAPAGSGAREPLAAPAPAAVAALEAVLGQRGHSAHHRRRRLAAGAPQRRNRSVHPSPASRVKRLPRCPCCASGAEASTCW